MLIGLLGGDGKILVAGWAHDGSNRQGITLTRYNADGSLDEGFGDHGLFILPNGAYAHSLAIDSDGKALIGGIITIEQARPERGPGISVVTGLFFLTRVNEAGLLDRNFGENGFVATDVGGVDKLSALTIQRDGKIVVSGTGHKDSRPRMIVARYDSRGSLDRTFGINGLVVRDLEKGQYDWATVSELPDRKLIVSSSVWSEKHLLLTRLLHNGAIDPAFAVGGCLTVQTGSLRERTLPVLEPDGKLLVSGRVIRTPKAGESQPPYYYDIVAARYLPDGRSDPSFGPDGMQVVSTGTTITQVAKVLAQEDGRVIVVGNTFNENKVDDGHLVLLGFRR